jgi:hypothetical protein
MINAITRISNEALRERWSTVTILTLILTAGKAWSIKDTFATDPGSFIAQVFFALVISFITAMIIHVVLYAIFSPKPTATPATVTTTQAPTRTKEEHEAAITAMGKDLAMASTPRTARTQANRRERTPVDLHEELGIARPSRASAPKAKRGRGTKAPKRKAAKKKK